MSWRNHRGWRVLVAGAGLLALAPALAGCGFQPLYGAGAGAGRAEANAALMQVGIANIPERRGQQLRNLLIDRFYETSRPDNSRYRLDASFQAGEQKLALRKDASAERAQLVMNAQYRLVDTASGKVVFSSSSRSFVSYNVPNDQFAAMSLVDSAYQRGLEQIADDITLRVAMFLSKPAAPAP
ncbi:LPS-assembly lipoprotein [Azospirillum fermentarium]|uniref:LPS assembly lipoprotein LptE n=1 Tax=Azospirillum fermentarium TaxID=1233114 RepID=UPI0022275C7E|nr:LPS assembly lipoprotein LptE [Azospirillum fermentarium]MCW2245228.1 LPS-assembly lipoprotein [Azospirillum fermentarium]